MSFEFAATVRARAFDVELTIADGETVAVLGPNGAGKSTLLTLIAGLVRPDTGAARLNDDVLFDIGDRGRGRWVPPHARGVSMLAQDALLFPHLTALDNVAFGPRSKGRSRAEANSRASGWLDRVDAGGLAQSRPAQLSGGQSQRIAVARALASDPALLLLDEPMAALDVSVAPAIRRMLRDVLADQTTIIVTHDVLDAFMLADRVVVLEGGRIVDVGPTREVLERPATQFAAGLAALNLVTGTALDDASVRADTGQRVAASFVESLDAGTRVGISVRPTQVAVTTEDPSEPNVARNVLPGIVTDLEPRGDVIRVRSAEFSADVPPGQVAELDLAPGTRVWFAFAASDAIAYRL